MPRRTVVITLPADDYQRLRDKAALEERAVDQQASYELRRALGVVASSEVCNVRADR